MRLNYSAYGVGCASKTTSPSTHRVFDSPNPPSPPLFGPLGDGQFRGAQVWLDIIGVSSDAPTGKDSVVAVVDNGIAKDHPDFGDRVSTDRISYRTDENGQTYAQATGQQSSEWGGWPNEYEDVQIVQVSEDESKNKRVNTITFPHGTAVAGIIGASGENLVRGVAPDVTLLDCNCADTKNRYVYTKLDWGVEFVDIYNNSWGPSTYPVTCSTFCQEMDLGTTIGRAGLGCLYVWSAGNSYQRGGNANLEAPLNWYSAIVVAARNIVDSERSVYSTVGANVLISGVGAGNFEDRTGVVTTGPDPDIAVNLRMNGTSAAAPMVSGVIAILLSEAKKNNLELQWSDVKEILCSSAQPAVVFEMRSIGPFDNQNSGMIEAMNIDKQDLVKRVPQKSGQRDRFFSPQHGYGTVNLRRALDVLNTYLLPKYERPLLDLQTAEGIVSGPYPKTITQCSVHAEEGFVDIQYLDFNTNLICFFEDPLVSLTDIEKTQPTFDEVIVTIYGEGGTDGLLVHDEETLTKLGICLVVGEEPAPNTYVYHTSWILSCLKQRNVFSSSLVLPTSKRLNTQFKSEAFRGIPYKRGQLWALYAGYFYHQGPLPNISIESCQITIRYRYSHI